jgi:hypothetical protein
MEDEPHEAQKEKKTQKMKQKKSTKTTVADSETSIGRKKI